MTKISEQHHGLYKSDEPLILVPFPNGGWTVTQRHSEMTIPNNVGAYSDRDDLLEALSAIIPEDTHP